MQHVRRFRTPILVGIGTLVGAIVIYLAVISPEGSSLSSLKARQTQLASQQTHLQAQLVLLKREKAHMATACSTLTEDITQIPGTPDVDDFLRQVTALAVASGDPNTPSISVTQATTAASGGVTPVAVTFELSGNYGQMNAFVHGLTSFPRLFTVSSILIVGGPAAAAGGAIAPGTPNYTLTLAGDIYYSVGRANVCSSSGTGATTTASH